MSRGAEEGWLPSMHISMHIGIIASSPYKTRHHILPYESNVPGKYKRYLPWPKTLLGLTNYNLETSNLGLNNTDSSYMA